MSKIDEKGGITAKKKERWTERIRNKIERKEAKITKMGTENPERVQKMKAKIESMKANLAKVEALPVVEKPDRKSKRKGQSKKHMK